MECEVPGVEAGRGVRGRLGGGARGGAMDFDWNRGATEGKFSVRGLAPQEKLSSTNRFSSETKSLVYSVFSSVAALLLYTNLFFVPILNRNFQGIFRFGV